MRGKKACEERVRIEISKVKKETREEEREGI